MLMRTMTPCRLRLLTRHALLQPPAVSVNQQLRATAIATSQPTVPVLSRHALPPQLRGFHSSRSRCVSEKTPSSTKSNKAAYDAFFMLVAACGFASSTFLGVIDFLDDGPDRTNPAHIIKESLEILRRDDKVTSRVGAPLTWSRVESEKIMEQDDEPSRRRVKYSLTGPNGTATVFAEVSQDSPSGSLLEVLRLPTKDYNYLVVQFDDTDEVVSVMDDGESWPSISELGGR